MAAPTSQASHTFEKTSAPSSPVRTSSSSSSTSEVGELNSLPQSGRNANTRERETSEQASPPSSPAKQEFLGALVSQSRGRSRSRSPNPIRNRSRSPIPPPTRMASEREESRTNRPSRSRQFSVYSGSTLVSDKGQSRRNTDETDPHYHGRENFYWQGRHSNAWLFNDFSVTDTIKRITRRVRRDS